MSGSNNITTAFVDLATYDELEKYLYGGLRADCYFVRCVRKSNWFSMIPVTLKATSGQRDFNSEFSVNITRAGDYLIGAWLRVTVPQLTTAAGMAAAGMIRWTRNFMHNLIKETWITFNDLTAMKFDNYWLDIWAAFTVPESKLNGYNNMIGNFDEFINPRAANPANVGPAATLPESGAVTLNLPLPYFFCLDSGVALPTAAIPYNDMRLNFEFRNWTELLVYDEGNIAETIRAAAAADINGGSVALTSVQVWANYAIVSNEERIKMGKCPRDIVIEQVQMVQKRDFNVNTFPNSYDIRLSHAVKALYWVVRNRTVSAEWSNYTDHRAYPTANGVTFNYGNDPVGDSSLIYENTTRLDQMGSDYYSLVQPWYHAPRIPGDTGYHMYAYALDIRNLDPQGSTNYGKLTNATISLNPTATAGTNDSQGSPTVVFDAVIRAQNFNVIRISGGAVGLILTTGGLNRQLLGWLESLYFSSLDKQCKLSPCFETNKVYNCLVAA